MQLRSDFQVHNFESAVVINQEILKIGVIAIILWACGRESRAESPEGGKVPFAAVSFWPTGKVLVVLVDSVVGQVHVSSFQVAGLEAK